MVNSGADTQITESLLSKVVSGNPYPLHALSQHCIINTKWATIQGLSVVSSSRCMPIILYPAI